MSFSQLTFTIGVVLITLSVIAGVVYLIITLIQIKKTVIKFDKLAQRVNSELDIISEFSSKISSLTKKLSSPIISIIFYILSSFYKGKKKSTHTGGEDE
jgi:uncharacterized protein YoxC